MVLKYAAYLLIGLMLGGILLFYARSLRGDAEKKILAVSLVVAAAIYIGFALIWGDAGWVLIEAMGVPLYALFAWLSLYRSGYWLALGWLLHPIWDLWLHLWGPGHAVAPEWYAVACFSFDILVASYIFMRISIWRKNVGMA